MILGKECKRVLQSVDKIQVGSVRQVPGTPNGIFA